MWLDPARCPRCRVLRFGPCPFCFPERAEADRARRLAAELAEEADRARRWCLIHAERDTCAAEGWGWQAQAALETSVNGTLTGRTARRITELRHGEP